MIPAIEAAKYLIQLAASAGEEAEPMTHMRVQKLLYYAQGWHIGLFGRPLFAECLQAWKNGPVVPVVDDTLRALFGGGPARPLVPRDLGPANLGGRDKVYLETVWNKYIALSATGLKELSHSEPPWIEARGAVPEGEPCGTEITTDSLRRFFGAQPEALLPNPHDLEAVYEGEAASREQPGVSFSDLRRRRREAV